MIDNFDGERSGAALDERFELLSAYLDGEVTASERKQVEAWLATDRAFQQQPDAKYSARISTDYCTEQSVYSSFG
jgi:anti-sigma factor RsiW